MHRPDGPAVAVAQLREALDAGASRQRAVVPLNMPPSAAPVVAGSGRTIVVLGLARGGTTLVAGLLQILGVEFGDRVTERGEDADVHAAMAQVKGPLAPLRFLAARRRIRRIVRERVDRWGTWGVKLPSLTPLMPLLRGTFPDPRYVAIFRNPMQVAVTQEKRTGVPLREGLVGAIVRQLLMARFVFATRRPALILSYEETVRQPGQAVDALAAFLGIELAEEQRARAIAFVSPSAGYMPSRRVLGWIETASARSVRGWIADLSDPARSLRVELWLDGWRIAEDVADRERPDVAEAGHHATGACGFDIDPGRALGEDERTRVVVYIPELKHHLSFRLDEKGEAVFHPPSEMIAMRSRAADA